MNAENEYPKSLLEAVRYFSDANVATEFFAKMRWPSSYHRFYRWLLIDGERFLTVMPGTIGRRITYKQLIGANEVENLPSSDEAGNADLPN